MFEAWGRSVARICDACGYVRDRRVERIRRFGLEEVIVTKLDSLEGYVKRTLASGLKQLPWSPCSPRRFKRSTEDGSVVHYC